MAHLLPSKKKSKQKKKKQPQKPHQTTTNQRVSLNVFEESGFGVGRQQCPSSWLVDGGGKASGLAGGQALPLWNISWRWAWQPPHQHLCCLPGNRLKHRSSAQRWPERAGSVCVPLSGVPVDARFPSIQTSSYTLLSYFLNRPQEHASLLLRTVVLASFYIYFLKFLSLASSKGHAAVAVGGSLSSNEESPFSCRPSVLLQTCLETSLEAFLVFV